PARAAVLVRNRRLQLHAVHRAAGPGDATRRAVFGVLLSAQPPAAELAGARRARRRSLAAGDRAPVRLERVRRFVGATVQAPTPVLRAGAQLAAPLLTNTGFSTCKAYRPGASYNFGRTMLCWP